MNLLGVVLFSNGLVSCYTSFAFLPFTRDPAREPETPTVSVADRQTDAQGEKEETMNGWMLSF